MFSRIVLHLEVLLQYWKLLGEGIWWLVFIWGFSQHTKQTLFFFFKWLSVCFCPQSPSGLGRYAAERAAKGGHPVHHLSCGDQAASLADHWSIWHGENLHPGPGSQTGSWAGEYTHPHLYSLQQVNALTCWNKYLFKEVEMRTVLSVVTPAGKNIHMYIQFPFQQVELLTASSVLTPTGENFHLYKQYPFQW